MATSSMDLLVKAVEEASDDEMNEDGSDEASKPPNGDGAVDIAAVSASAHAHANESTVNNSDGMDALIEACNERSAEKGDEEEVTTTDSALNDTAVAALLGLTVDKTNSGNIDVDGQQQQGQKKDPSDVATILGSFRFQSELNDNPDLANGFLGKLRGPTEEKNNNRSQRYGATETLVKRHATRSSTRSRTSKRGESTTSTEMTHLITNEAAKHSIGVESSSTKRPNDTLLSPSSTVDQAAIESVIKHNEYKKQRVKARNEARLASHPELRKNDVLLGRGSGIQNHPGNANFRKLIKALKPTYTSARRNQKRTVCAQIIAAIEEMSPPGRFVIERDGRFQTIPYQKAIEKTSQALREKEDPVFFDWNGNGKPGKALSKSGRSPNNKKAGKAATISKSRRKAALARIRPVRPPFCPPPNNSPSVAGGRTKLPNALPSPSQTATV